MLGNTRVVERLVVLEGVDGAGTTTQGSLLAQRFEKEAIPVWMTAEPTHSRIGSLIRSILQGEHDVRPETMAYLFAADRWEHLWGMDGILDHVKRGDWVITDRYFFSSLAYQGLLTDTVLVERLNAPFPLPEYLFFIDVPKEVASRRREHRGSPELYDATAFQEKVADKYAVIIDAVRRTGTKVHSFPGDEDVSTIHEGIWKCLPLADI